MGGSAPSPTSSRGMGPSTMQRTWMPGRHCLKAMIGKRKSMVAHRPKRGDDARDFYEILQTILCLPPDLLYDNPLDSLTQHTWSCDKNDHMTGTRLEGGSVLWHLGASSGLVVSRCNTYLSFLFLYHYLRQLYYYKTSHVNQGEPQA
jgi:hypothetical protein